MKILITSCVAFLSLIGSLKAETVNCDDLRKKWERQKIYHVPTNSDSMLWNGSLFDYESEKCFRVEHNGMECKLTVIKCDEKLSSRAKFENLKYKDFKAFKEKLLSCLEPVKPRCLKGLMSKTIKVSFGAEPYVDRRDLFFKMYKPGQIAAIGKQLRAENFDKQKGNERHFGGGEDGMGLRGTITFSNDHWLLTSYLGGD